MNTQINIWIVLSILLIHWFADFVLQTDWEAKNKSNDNNALLQHTSKYSLVWMALSLVYCMYDGSLWMMLFAPITFVLHTITDYFTSRLNTKLFKVNKIHEFFVSIGFDQWLHFLQLILTYQLLS
jgi:hypothetical protein